MTIHYDFYIRGNVDKGPAILAFFEKWGAKNINNLSCDDPERFYFIDNENRLCYTTHGNPLNYMLFGRCKELNSNTFTYLPQKFSEVPSLIEIQSCLGPMGPIGKTLTLLLAFRDYVNSGWAFETKSPSELAYCVNLWHGTLQLTETAITPHLFAFPTKELRDYFYHLCYDALQTIRIYCV